MNPTIYTAGPKPDESLIAFIQRLREHSITAVADCRSQTEQRQTLQFTQYNLKQALKSNGIAYAYVGAELGDKPDNKKLYATDGTLKRASLVRTRIYRQGINRIVTGAERYVVCVFDTDHDDNAHRDTCIARTLKHRGFQVISLNAPQPAEAAVKTPQAA